MRYRDTEHGTIYTVEQLKQSYNQLYRDGETEAETFADYLRNCTDKNGILERITEE